MPNNIVKSFAEKSGRSENEVERLWAKAENIVKNDYAGIEVNTDDYYKLVTGVLKNMLQMENVEDDRNPILEDALDMIKDILQKKKERIHTNKVEKDKAKNLNPDEVKDTNSNYNDGKTNVDPEFGSRLVRYLDTMFPSMTVMGGKITKELRPIVKTGDNKELKRTSGKVRDTVYKEYMKFLDNVEKRIGKILTKPK